VSEANLTWELKWIDSEAELTAAAKQLAKEELLSVDTETAGWQSGNEKLCLIQIGVPSKKLVLMVDPLAIADISALGAPLQANTPILVAHNASFEERQFARHGLKMRGVVDTLEMARRLRPDLESHTLRNCCLHLLGISLDKEEQTSDWSRRPLSEEQIKYAALDAEVAINLYLALLELENRLVVDTKLSIEELMHDFTDVSQKKFELTREISTELAYLDLRAEALRKAVRAKLVDGEEPYEGQWGKCKITKIKQTEINPQKVRSELPEIAELVIQEYVEKKKLELTMKEHGIDLSKISRVEIIKGHTDRLSIQPGELD